jgi:Domain of Unknown Function (DUF748)
VRCLVGGFLIIVLAALIARPFLPQVVRWYVNKALNQSVLYKGRIGDVELHLWRGAYSIHDVRILKTTGNIPVPLFSASEVDLAIQWSALWHRKVVGQIVMYSPQVNFVDSPDPDQSETGSGGPWLQMVRGLFPFDINSVLIQNGSIHFRAYQHTRPVDIYLSQLQAEIDDLSNIDNSVAPLLTSVHATGLAMDQAKFEFLMKLDPFSYDPTFHLGARMLNLDLTKINEFTKAYGGFDIKRGLFDLVIEIDANEGQLQGYVKPLFRNMVIFDLVQDVKQDNVLQVFWQAIVGSVAAIFTNYHREQLGTLIPFTGSLQGPQVDLLSTVGNVLRNAFIRAYLPRMEKSTQHIDNLEFSPPSITDPISVGDMP